MPKTSLTLHKIRVALLSLGLTLFSCYSAPAQTGPSPDRDQLLNGLRILFFPIPGSPTVTLKLRIHSGAAFDLAGRAGEMSLLGDLLFPDQATLDYFNGEQGGKLDVNVNYDSITVTMIGKASEFDNVIEVLRNGLVQTQLTPDVIGKVKDGQTKILKETSVSPAVVADRAVSTRLFGDFPYGRPVSGTPEDLGRIERADLMLARERFLNSNNATLAIIGGVTKARAMRTLRQLLGPWRKSESLVPTTFRQPTAPDPRVLLIQAPTDAAEIRIAFRGLSRQDPDIESASVLAKIVQYRWAAEFPELARKPTSARSETHTLPGQFVIGTAVETAKVADAITSAKKTLASLVDTPPTASEIDRARRDISVERKPIGPENLSDPWLDMDTYHLSAPVDELAALNSVNAASVQRVAAKLFKEAVPATIVVGEVTQLKAALQGHVNVEVLGEATQPLPAKQKIPAKPNF